MCLLFNVSLCINVLDNNSSMTVLGKITIGVRVNFFLYSALNSVSYLLIMPKKQMLTLSLTLPRLVLPSIYYRYLSSTDSPLKTPLLMSRMVTDDVSTIMCTTMEAHNSERCYFTQMSVS